MSAGHWRCRFVRAAWTWPSLLLLLVLAWHLSGLRFGLAHVSESRYPTGDDVPELDSFSEPAVALAILQQHVRDLYFAHTLSEAGTNKSAWLNQGVSGPHTEAQPNGSESASFPPCSRNEEMSQRGPSGNRWLNSTSVYAGCTANCLEDLLPVQFEKQRWNDFLDCYLELLAVAPEKVAVVSWTRSALACSQVCGRTDEVLSGLQHFIRFSEDTKIITRLECAIDDWKAGRVEASRSAIGPLLKPTHDHYVSPRLLRRSQSPQNTEAPAGGTGAGIGNPKMGLDASPGSWREHGADSARWADGYRQ
jgi:hypothetical protein